MLLLTDVEESFTAVTALLHCLSLCLFCARPLKYQVDNSLKGAFYKWCSCVHVLCRLGPVSEWNCDEV